MIMLSCSLLLKGILHPASNFLLKPLLAGIHNFLVMPIGGFGHHLCKIISHAIAPIFGICRAKFQTSMEDPKVVSKQNI